MPLSEAQIVCRVHGLYRSFRAISRRKKAPPKVPIVSMETTNKVQLVQREIQYPVYSFTGSFMPSVASFSDATLMGQEVKPSLQDTQPGAWPFMYCLSRIQKKQMPKLFCKMAANGDPYPYGSDFFEGSVTEPRRTFVTHLVTDLCNKTSWLVTHPLVTHPRYTPSLHTSAEQTGPVT